ncbi:MAG: hypothetical protein Kow0037_22790 [Calditrichia bacterium]
MIDEINQMDWREVLERLQNIREQEDYSGFNVDFIRATLQSEDEKIRAGAALAAEGCIMEPHILDLLLDLAENDPSLAVRRAAIRPLGVIIHEGILNNAEDPEGADTTLDSVDDWNEIQEYSFQDNYLRVKDLLFRTLEDQFEDPGVREAALQAISDLGYLEEVRDWIRELVQSGRESSQLVAVRAMGKFPHYWIEELKQFLDLGTPKDLLLEAISSAYSSESEILAERLLDVLESDDPEIISFALLTLANINKTPQLGEILQKFSLYPSPIIQEAAKEAINMYSGKSLDSFMKDQLGFSDE